MGTLDQLYGVWTECSWLHTVFYRYSLTQYFTGTHLHSILQVLIYKVFYGYSFTQYFNGTHLHSILQVLIYKHTKKNKNCLVFTFRKIWVFKAIYKMCVFRKLNFLTTILTLMIKFFSFFWFHAFRTFYIHK